MSPVRDVLWNQTAGRPTAPVRLLAGFALVAVFAVLGTVVAELALAVGWPGVPFVYYLVGTTLGLALGAVVGLWLVARLFDRRPFVDYGLGWGRAWWRDLLAGLALVLAVQAGVLGVGYAAGWVLVTDTLVADGGLLSGVVASLVLFAAVALYEELVFRGFVLKNVAEALADRGAWVAVVAASVVSSLLFGLVHLGNAEATPAAVAVIAVVALTLAAGYVLTGRLGFALGLHAGWNIALGVLFGLPVSGIEVPASLLALEVTGPIVWTGGSFGPEGGLLGVFAALLALAGTVLYAWAAEGELRAHPDVLVPRQRRDPAAAGSAAGASDSPIGSDVAAETE